MRATVEVDNDVRRDMYPLRRSLIPVILAGALFAAAAHAGAVSGAGQALGPVFQLATISLRMRLGRGMRGAKLRTIAWLRRPAPGTAATGGSADANVRLQLSSNDTSARGPPRFAVTNP